MRNQISAAANRERKTLIEGPLQPCGVTDGSRQRGKSPSPRWQAKCKNRSQLSFLLVFSRLLFLCVFRSIFW